MFRGSIHSAFNIKYVIPCTGKNKKNGFNIAKNIKKNGNKKLGIDKCCYIVPHMFRLSYFVRFSRLQKSSKNNSQNPKTNPLKDIPKKDPNPKITPKTQKQIL
jgi:hypothetical protein